MKKTVKAFRIAVLLVACCLLLCGCVHSLKVNDNDTYTDRKTGVTYVPLSACYEPASLGEEYASFKLSGMKTMLYTVGALAPENVLGSAYNGVYANQSLVLPTFEEMEMTRVLIYTKTATTIPVLTLKAEDAAQQGVIDALRSAYLGGARVSYPSFYTQQSAYTLRFEASNLPDIYYCISYIEYEEDIYDIVDGVETNLGRYFLYDRYNKICVAVDGTLHELLTID
ncbi:MAG: hypothetical protein IJW40_09590 [Clostridia bacterium]|nr:hypothetical protein [Clostridia bacterium]